MVDQSGKMKRVQVTCVPSGLSDSNLHLIWRLEHGGGRESHDGKVGKDIGAKAKATNFFLVPTEMSARLRVSVKILVRNGEGFSLESNFFVVRARASLTEEEDDPVLLGPVLIPCWPNVTE